MTTQLQLINIIIIIKYFLFVQRHATDCAATKMKTKHESESNFFKINIYVQRDRTGNNFLVSLDEWILFCPFNVLTKYILVMQEIWKIEKKTFNLSDLHFNVT